MDKFDKEILVIERELLFCDGSFEGFKPHSEDSNYETLILNNFKFLRRGDVEEDPSHKQPIGYALLVNPETNKVFAYQRSTKAGEKRLHGKWSWGIGGHVERSDQHIGNPVYLSLLRELEEEVEMDGKILDVNVLGYINDDSNQVGEVHFGILYLIKTDSTTIEPRDSEIEVGAMLGIEELEKKIADENVVVEDWSRISFDPLKEYLQA
ncbi:MAG: DNA mismatch repair protein MutT [Nanoarchaeota archaeon]|nr:DNA mismatch repair protein MutT [Nanoarchaeota archaeon]